MVETEARNTVTSTMPAAIPLDLVAPAACNSWGSFDPAPAGAVAVAGESSAGCGGAPDDASGSAAGVPDDVSVAGVVAAGVVVSEDGGEGPATDGVEAAAGAEPSPSPAAASAASQATATCQTSGQQRPRQCAHAERTVVAWVGQVADVGDDGLRLAEEQADGAGRELGRGAEAGRLRAEEAPELGAAGGERRRADAEDVADARGQAERRRRAAGQSRERRRRRLLLLRRGQRRRRDHDGEGESQHLEPPPRHGGTRRAVVGGKDVRRLVGYAMARDETRRGCAARDAEGGSRGAGGLYRGRLRKNGGGMGEKARVVSCLTRRMGRSI